MKFFIPLAIILVALIVTGAFEVRKRKCIPKSIYVFSVLVLWCFVFLGGAVECL